MPDFPLSLGKGIRVSPKARKDPYVHVPVELVKRAQLAGGAFSVSVAMLVAYKQAVTGEEAVSISNVAALKFGLTRKQKAYGLEALERAGVVSVERNQGQSPIARLIHEVGHSSDR
jgi:hypothetical protein